MAFVVDAPIAAAWVLPDEEAVLADWALDRLGVETAGALSLIWHELRNLLLSTERRRPNASPAACKCKPGAKLRAI